MWIIIEIFEPITPIGIQCRYNKVIIDIEDIYNVWELEDGTLQIFFIDSNDYILTKQYTLEEFLNFLKKSQIE